MIVQMILDISIGDCVVGEGCNQMCSVLRVLTHGLSGESGHRLSSILSIRERGTKSKTIYSIDNIYIFTQSCQQTCDKTFELDDAHTINLCFVGPLSIKQQHARLQMMFDY